MAAEIANNLNPIIYAQGNRGVPSIEVCSLLESEIRIAAERFYGRAILRPHRRRHDREQNDSHYDLKHSNFDS
jgi:hypothetical protein